MRIAQLAPLVESVPPLLYGGTERVIAALTEELIRRGHEVTLFASGDSRTAAELIPVVPQALRLAGIEDALPAHLVALGMLAERQADFDIIHSHLDLLALPIARLLNTPMVHTLHRRLDLPEVQPVFNHFQDAALVSISDNQRRLLPDWNWQGTVYNGIDLNTYSFHPQPGSYLAFLGRTSPEKGLEEAIQVAERTGIPLKIAAKVDPTEQDYYESRIRPLLDGPLVEYVGEITEREKDSFLGHALALVFPISWPEPFGLVMVEAMATGTPILTSRYGSVPEIVVDGSTGFVCDSVAEMALACERLGALDRAACRRCVEERFSAAAMTNGYEAVYVQLASSTSSANQAVRQKASVERRQRRTQARSRDNGSGSPAEIARPSPLARTSDTRGALDGSDRL